MRFFKGVSNNTKLNWSIFFIIGLVSILLTFIIINFAYPDNYPLIVALEEKMGAAQNFHIYHDFDNDGNSEELISMQNSYSKKSIVSIKNHMGKILDDFNFSGELIVDGLFFEDFNQDQYDELFVFYKDKDSLFFNIIDYRNLTYLIQRAYLISKPDSAKENFWDIRLVEGSGLNINRNGNLTLLFALSGGYSIFPRAAYCYDFSQKKIVNKFETGAPFFKIQLADINNDNHNEVIINTSVAGNYAAREGYHDFTSWIFILNDSLKQICDPFSKGEYTSGLLSLHLLKSSGNVKLAAAYVNPDDHGDPTRLIMLNTDLKIMKEKAFPLSRINTFLFEDQNQDRLLISIDNKKCILLDSELNVLNEIDSYQFDFIPIAAIDLNLNGRKEIIFLSSNELLILSADLKIAGLYKLNSPILYNNLYSFRYLGNKKSLQLGINGINYSYLFSFSKNVIYSYRPLLIVLLSILLSLILFLSVDYIIKSIVYRKFFAIHFFDSQNGYLLVKNNGKILAHNKKMVDFFKTREKSFKGQTVGIIFSDYKELDTVIKHSMATQQSAEIPIFINSSDFLLNGKVFINPIYLFSDVVFAYLIRFIDYNQPFISERLQVWSRSIQKIAHDIKTPLSTILLNLKSLEIQLDEEETVNKKAYMQDIQMIREEILRVKNLTSGFLKFVDLEKPKFQLISFNECLRNSIDRFKNITGNLLSIEYEENSEDLNAWADPRQVELLQHILIENAIDAVSGNGRVSIELDKIQDLSLNDKNFIQFLISDSGSGIPSSLQSKIFEPYFTTKKSGTGIGLAFAKKIAEDHGGKIEFYSRDGFGTTFKVLIPLFENHKLHEYNELS